MNKKEVLNEMITLIETIGGKIEVCENEQYNHISFYIDNSEFKLILSIHSPSNPKNAAILVYFKECGDKWFRVRTEMFLYYIHKNKIVQNIFDFIVTIISEKKLNILDEI